MTKPKEGEIGSAPINLYFLHCDGKYRNAIRQVLQGVEGQEVRNACTKKYDELMADLLFEDPKNYGKPDKISCMDSSLMSVELLKNGKLVERT